MDILSLSDDPPPNRDESSTSTPPHEEDVLFIDQSQDTVIASGTSLDNPLKRKLFIDNTTSSATYAEAVRTETPSNYRVFQAQSTGPISWANRNKLSDVKSALKTLKPFLQRTVFEDTVEEPVLIIPKGFNICYPNINNAIQAFANMLNLKVHDDPSFEMVLSASPGSSLIELAPKEFISRLSPDRKDSLARAINALYQVLVSFETVEPKVYTHELDLGHQYANYLYGKYFQQDYFGVLHKNVKIMYKYQETVETKFLDIMKELYPSNLQFPLYIRNILQKIAYFLIHRYHENDDTYEGCKRLFDNTKNFYINNNSAVEKLYKRVLSKKLTEDYKKRSAKQKKPAEPKPTDYEQYYSVHKPYINDAKKIISPTESMIIKKLNVHLQNTGLHLLPEPVILNQDVRKNVLNHIIENLHVKATDISNRLERRKRLIHDSLVKKRESDPAFSALTKEQKKKTAFSTEEWKKEIDEYFSDRNVEEEFKQAVFSIFGANSTNDYSTATCCKLLYSKLTTNVVTEASLVFLAEQERLKTASSSSSSSSSSDSS